MIELDFPEGKGPPEYWRIIAALEDLLDNMPTHPDLVAEKEELAERDPPDRIHITQSNVATEARVKRDLISGEGARFKKLGAYIKSLRPTHGVSINTSARLNKQADDIRRLGQRIVVLRSKVAAALVAKEEIWLDLDEARRDLARARGKAVEREASGSAHHAAGASQAA